MIRKILIPALLACASAASAQATLPSQTDARPVAADPAKFAERKQKLLNRINARLQLIKSLQSCVQSANDQAAIKACKQSVRQDRKKPS